MAGIDEIQDAIHLSSARGIEDSFNLVYGKILEKGDYSDSLDVRINDAERDEKFSELEQLCTNSGAHPFICDLERTTFKKDGFRYFGVAFYTHIYHAFEDVIFGIAQNAPPFVSLRSALVDNLWDEFGAGRKREAHLRIYEDTVLSYLQLRPLDEDEVLWIGRGAEAEACLFNTKYGVDRAATVTAQMWSRIGQLPFRAALGATVFGSEFTPRCLFPPIISCMKRSGIPEDVSKFFSLHAVCDEHHYSDLRRAFYSIISTRGHLAETEAGLRIMLKIREVFFDHLHGCDILN